MAKHIFTPEETARAVATSRAVRTMKKQFHWQKQLAKLGIEGETKTELLSIVRTALTSPVIAGTIAFFIVQAAESLANKVKESNMSPQQQAAFQNSQKAASQFASQFIQSSSDPITTIFRTLGIAQPLASFGLQLGSEGLLGNGDYELLKGAIIAYIASGGNLAGLLSSGTNLITKGAALLK